MEKELIFIIDKRLYNATKQGDLEKVKRALDSGVSPDACEDEYKTPLLSVAAEVNLFNLLLSNA